MMSTADLSTLGCVYGLLWHCSLLGGFQQAVFSLCQAPFSVVLQSKPLLFHAITRMGEFEHWPSSGFRFSHILYSVCLLSSFCGCGICPLAWVFSSTDVCSPAALLAPDALSLSGHFPGRILLHTHTTWHGIC